MMFKITKKGFILLLGLFAYTGQTLLFAQSDLKEGNNSFALYTKTQDFKHLEAAKKRSDEAYKTPKDSTSYKNNLLRSLVYSSLAVADGERKLKYAKDPIDEARYSLNQLTDKNLNYDNQGQLTYIKRKLALAYQVNAKKALNNNDYETAFQQFLKVDSFSNGTLEVQKNLAVLSDKLGNKQEAIRYYKQYLFNRGETQVQDYLILAKLFQETGDKNAAINTLKSALDYYPKNKKVYFRLLNIYANDGSYDAIVPLVSSAIELDPNNIDLLYLAGYAYEVTGNVKKAESYYLDVLRLDPNNYNANLELGLLNLKVYMQEATEEKRISAEKYLLKANEVDPTAVNALKALAVLFKETGDMFQYERVQNQINQ